MTQINYSKPRVSKVDMARALAGSGASQAEVIGMLYRLDRWEHELWFGAAGETRFPSFEEWVLDSRPVPTQDKD